VQGGGRTFAEVVDNCGAGNLRPLKFCQERERESRIDEVLAQHRSVSSTAAAIRS
jgi:hypothetical protein